MKINTQEVAGSISQLIPSIIQGAQLDFLSESPVTHSQFFILVAIHSRVECSMSDLAHNMHIRMPTATGLVNRLVRSHYILRIPSANDRRKVVVRLTAKGKLFVKKFQETIQVRWNDVLKSLDQGELAQMDAIVNKLKTELQKKNHEK